MHYKLIALDIDGTIRDANHPPSARTQRVLDKAREHGVIVTLVTGRIFKSAIESTAELDITSPIICSQGAYIANPTTGEILSHRHLTPNMVRSALNELTTWRGDVVAYRADQVYVSKITPWIEDYSQRMKGQVTVVTNLTELATQGVTRLLAVGDESEVHRLELRLKTTLNSTLYITQSLPHFCEILHPDGGKHNGLAWLCRYLGVRQEETIAFGNGYEDVPMLRWSGLGVAMDGAAAEVVEAADKVAPPMDEDGVAQVLEELIEQGLGNKSDWP